jgi:predicted CXXCH cytochrome family protein
MLGGSRQSKIAALKAALLFAPLVAVGTFLSCERNIVYRDRVPFNPPPDAASGFLGYYDANTKQTTCGNCHADYQVGWVQTAHANAFATLHGAPGRRAECYTCHTVTGKGNATTAVTAGYDAVQHAAYQDVQCESCHGPGLQHVEGIARGQVIRPLARIGLAGSGNCGDCHSGAHQPFVEEWSASRHANLNVQRATNVNCQGCHEARGALARFGERGNFVEKNDAAAHQPPATCATCHDPHGSPNSAQLRFAIEHPDPEQNLCMRCHLRVGEPTFTATSPHAPQGAVLLGFAGWKPPNFQYDTARIFGSHATDRNPRLCAGCHVAKYTVTDQLTGAFVFQSTGHLMRPIPCLDSQGRPTADKNCAYTAQARSWQTCATSNCHGSAQAAANIFNDSRQLMRSFTDQLWRDLNGNATLNPAPTDGGLLAIVRQQRPGEWSTTDNRITPAEGAEFNARLCGEYGQATSDNSKGVHNPFLCRALLISTIAFIREYYNLPAASPASTSAAPAANFAVSRHPNQTVSAQD